MDRYPPQRLKDSCNTCSKAKVRCNKVKPSCERCQRRGIPCDYSVSQRSGRPRRLPHPAQSERPRKSTTKSCDAARPKSAFSEPEVPTYTSPTLGTSPVPSLLSPTWNDTPGSSSLLSSTDLSHQYLSTDPELWDTWVTPPHEVADSCLTSIPSYPLNEHIADTGLLDVGPSAHLQFEKPPKNFVAPAATPAMVNSAATLPSQPLRFGTHVKQRPSPTRSTSSTESEIRTMAALASSMESMQKKIDTVIRQGDMYRCPGKGFVTVPVGFSCPGSEHLDGKMGSVSTSATESVLRRSILELQDTVAQLREDLDTLKHGNSS